MIDFLAIKYCDIRGCHSFIYIYIYIYVHAQVTWTHHIYMHNQTESARHDMKILKNKDLLTLQSWT